MDQGRNLKWNFKIFGNKWKYNLSNLGDDLKAVCRGKFTTWNAYTRKEELKINNLSFHLKKLEIEKQYKCTAIRRKIIIKIRAEIS